MGGRVEFFSKLSEALSKLADKGENIPVDRLQKRLENEGVRQDEQDASGITNLTEAAKENRYIGEENIFESDFFGSAFTPTNNEWNTFITTTRQGNLAVTPEGLRVLDESRRDRDLINTNFRTVDETGTAHQDLYDEGDEKLIDDLTSSIRRYLPFRMLHKEAYPERLERLEEYANYGDDYGLTKEQIEQAAKELEDFNKFLENPNSVDINSGLNLEILPLDSGEEDSIRRVQNIMDEYDHTPETDLISDDYTNWNNRIKKIVEKDLIETGILGADFRRQIGEMYDFVAPPDINLETYGVLILRDPRDNFKDYSAHFSYIGRERYSYHMRYDVEDNNALRVFEMQRDVIDGDIPSRGQFLIFKEFPQKKFGGSGNKWDKNNFLLANPSKWEEWADDVNLEAFPKEDLREITNQVERIRNLNIALEQVEPEDFDRYSREIETIIQGEQDALENLNKLWNRLADKGPPKELELNYYQSLINTSLVKASDEGLQEVKFLINPDVETAERITRSPVIQNHYENVVAGQIRRTAERIGATLKWDNKGYMVVGLPAAGFSLPLYAEENKEGSFLATTQARGENLEEAREYLNSRNSESTELPRTARGDFNTGGKVLGSLQRTRKYEGGQAQEEGFFKKADRWIQKQAAKLGFDAKRNLGISADATNITNRMVDQGQLPEINRIYWGAKDRPLSADQLVEAGSREQIGFIPNPEGNMPDERVYDTINHALFGWESAESPKAKWGGQAKEVYQALKVHSARRAALKEGAPKEELDKLNWRTEYKDLWNNQWGINQRQAGLSREEINNKVVDAILETQRKIDAGEPLRMGQDLVINAMDLAKRNPRNTGGKILGSLHRNCA